MPIYALNGAQPSIHRDSYVHPDAVVIGAVKLGAQASIWPAAVLRADFGEIHVGARTSIQDGTVLHTTEQWPTIIGEDCVVGHNTHLEGCTVGDRCLIGSGAVVLNRVVIGSGCVIGAQALLPEDTKIPDMHMALGVPARVRRMNADVQAEWIRFGVGEYLRNGERYRRELTEITREEATYE